MPENDYFKKKYYDSKYYPHEYIKLNGTSIHCQCPGQSYNLIQFRECTVLFKRLYCMLKKINMVDITT